jgi:hypothetical protein
MKRTHPIFFLFLSCGLIACEQESANTADGESWSLDSGSQPDTDRDVDQELDGNTPSEQDVGPLDLAEDADATTDASRADAPSDVTLTGSITVRVEGNGTPLSALPVVFSDPTGQVVEVATTDAEGRVICDAPNATMATFGLGNGSFYDPYRLLSVNDLKPGQTTVFRLGSVQPRVGTGALSVQLPGPFQGASWYLAMVGCGQSERAQNANSPLSLRVDSRCPTGPTGAQTLDALGLAFDGQNRAIAYAFAPDQPFDRQRDQISLAMWSRDFDTVPIELLKAPAGAQAIGAEVGTLRNGLRWRRVDGRMVAPSASRTASLALRIPTVPNIEYSTVQATAAMPNPQGPGQASVSYMRDRHVHPLPASISIQLEDELLPFVDNIDFVGRNSVEWQMSAGSVEPDAMVVFLNWSRGTTESQWILFLAPDQPQVTLPVLPSELEERGYQSDDMVSVRGFGFEAETILGWDEFGLQPSPGIFDASYDEFGKVRMSLSPGF